MKDLGFCSSLFRGSEELGLAACIAKQNVVNRCMIKHILYVVVNFLSQLIFIFPLLQGMVMYANEFETKEKQKLNKIKN